MWTANVFATYQKTFAEAHNLKVMAGWSADRNAYRYFYARRTGLTDYNLPNIQLTDGTTYQTSGSHVLRATTGFFGRINYDYKGIYLFEANGRYDGSSRITEDDFHFVPNEDPAKPGHYELNAGIPSQAALEGVGTFTYGPGDVKFKDLNGDGVINFGDPNMKDENGDPIPVRSTRSIIYIPCLSTSSASTRNWLPTTPAGKP